MENTPNSAIGLGIEEVDTYSNPWGDSGSSNAPTSSIKSGDSTDYIKPIRLAKRHEKKATTNTLGASESTAPAPSGDDFQCRPIRLGSRSKENISKESISNKSTPSVTKSIEIKNLPIVEPYYRNKDSNDDDMIFAVCLVDFHHVRGPEVQWWKSNYHPDYEPSLFKNLPFQALPDGSHLFEETFSNFNLVYNFKNGTSIDNLEDLDNYEHDPRNLKTLFGCSCVMQIRTDLLSAEERERNKDFTRSIVQKAVVVIARKQPIFAKIKDKLVIITKSYFQQDDFNNISVLESLFDNLNTNFKLVDNELEIEDISLREQQKSLKEEEFFVNLNLKDTIFKFKQNFMTIFKCLLLEKKVLIFSNSNLEMLTQFQNNLISLIPNLINCLDDCGCPLIDFVETDGPLMKPSSLNTTNRKSMLRFFGLPLQIFNTKGSFWNPYLPLQQLDELNTESFMVGCSNLLFVNQSERLKVDLLINLDTNEVSYPIGKGEALSLSSNDKKFMNNLIQTLSDQNDEYHGNDDYIRHQFEDYLLSLLSSTRYSQYVEKFKQAPPGYDLKDDLGNTSLFNSKFMSSWKSTNNYRIWHAVSDEFMFNFIDPKHIGLSINNPTSSNKISDLFSNFRFKPATTEHAITDDIKVHKFISNDKDEEPENIDKSEIESSISDDKPNLPEKNEDSSTKKSLSWNWGFMKK